VLCTMPVRGYRSTRSSLWLHVRRRMQNTIRIPRMAKPTTLARTAPTITPAFKWGLLDAEGVEVADIVGNDCVGVAKSAANVTMVRITVFAITRVY